MSLPSPVKSLVYIIVSGMVVWILGGVCGKFLNLIDWGAEKAVLTAFFWIGMFAIIVLPQYFAWFTEVDLKFITPILSIGILAGTIAGMVVLSLIKIRLLDTITLSDFSDTVFSFLYWIVIIGMLTVPQYLLYSEQIEEA